MNVLIIVPLLVLLLLRSSLVIRHRRGNGNGKPWPNCNYFTITQGLRVITLTEELSKVTFVGITTHETIATWETDSWSFKSIGWREWKRLSIYSSCQFHDRLSQTISDKRWGFCCDVTKVCCL